MRSLIILSLLISLITVNSAFERQRDCKCRAPASGRIVNGRDALKGSYPWQLTLQMKDQFNIPSIVRPMIPEQYKITKHGCGLTLLNNRWALTAAHCVPEFGADYSKEFQVGGGDSDLVKIFNNNNYMAIESTYAHPQFGPYRSGVINDIALVKFKRPVAFNKYIQPACIPDHDRDLYDGILKITGWGSTKTIKADRFTGEMEQAVPYRFLQEGNTKDLSNEMELCEFSKKELICLNNQSTNESACKGDSGGPLHWTKNGKTQVVGVTSFGEPTELEGTVVELCTGPTAYTRISNYIDWIREHIGDEYCT